VSTVEQHRGAVAARVLSEVLTPAVVNVFVAVAIGLHSHALVWGILIALAAGGLPLVGILLSVRAGRLGDHHVTNRGERPIVIMLILVTLVMCFIAQLAVGAPQPMIALTAAMLATLTVLGGITVGFRVKISVHAAVAAGTSTMLSIAISPLWALSGVLVMALMWARVRIQDHSLGQVITGAVVGSVVAGVVFWLVS